MNIYALELSRIPNASLKILQRLAKTLLRDQPTISNEIIKASRDRLEKLIAKIDAILIARFIESNPELIATEVSFDRGVDGLWVLLRQMLEQRRAFAHPGLDALPPELAKQAGLGERREEARAAQRLWTRLFAAEGTAFTKTRYILQVESMSTLLQVIDQEGLRDELVSVVGEGMIKLLEKCQVHYEAMVTARLHRQSGASENLNDFRRELRWGLVAYVQAVQSLYDPEAPETAELVLDALRPILVLREQMTQAGSESELVLEDFVELELPQADEAELEDEDELAAPDQP